MKENVTILIYTFPQPGAEEAAFAKIVASIGRTWGHVGLLKTVIVASHRFAAVVVRLIVKETPDGKRTWMVAFSNRKELTEVPTTGEAATVKATRLNPPSTRTVLKSLIPSTGRADQHGLQSRTLHLTAKKCYNFSVASGCYV